MSTDIRGYLEYRADASGQYDAWAAGRLALPRDYLWFALLAGVRNTFGVTPLPAQGFPADASWPVLEEFFVEVVPDGTPERRPDGWFRQIPALGAAQWLTARPALRDTTLDAYFGRPLSASPTRLLQDGDAYAPSWVGVDDLERVRTRYRAACAEHPGYRQARDVPVEVRALLAALYVLPHARFVYWFDTEP